MATNPQPTVTSTVTPTNAKSIVDMLIAQQMMSILQGKGTLRTISWQQISEIIVVMSLDDVKSAIIAAASTIKQLIMGGTLWNKCVSVTGSIWGAIRYVLYGWLVSLWTRRQKPLISNIPIHTIHTATITFKINPIIERIIVQLQKLSTDKHNDKEGYTINSTVKWDVKNLEETIITEIWSNIHFTISEGICATISDNMEIYWKIQSGNKTMMKINEQYSEEYNIVPISYYKSFRTSGRVMLCDLPHWTDCVRTELRKIDDIILPVTDFTKTSVLYYYFGSYVLVSQHIIEPLVVLDALVDNNGKFLNTFKQEISHINFGHLFGLNYENVGAQSYAVINSCMPGFNAVSLDRKTQYLKYFTSVFDKKALHQLCMHLACARKNQHIDFNNVSDTIKQTSEFTIVLTSDTVQPQDMIHKFNEYGHSLIDDYVKPSGPEQKQKIYTVMRIHSENKKSIENPKYKEWENNIKLLQTTFGSNKPTTEKELSPQLIRSIGTPPPTTIEEITYTTTIESKEMNEIYKPFDTLYVRGDDHKRIKSSLQMFRDRRDLLQNLGLPNKYGLLLTGPPGTGKTSTIYAVATELQKPIWYVQLSRELTCGDLRLMFEHIYKIKGGGIIVFEDIDSMTDIVLARSEKATEQSSIFDVSNSENIPLTLSYFLNFLDGALTQNGSIIIATTNHPERLDPAFKRPGRFDLTVELGNADYSQIRAIFKRMMGREIASDILNRVQEHAHSPAAIIFRIKDYMLDSTVTDEFILEPFFTLEKAFILNDECTPIVLKRDAALLAELHAYKK